MRHFVVVVFSVVVVVVDPARRNLNCCCCWTNQCLAIADLGSMKYFTDGCLVHFQRRGQVVQFFYIKLESFQIVFKERCSKYSCKMLKEKYQKIVRLSVAFPST